MKYKEKCTPDGECRWKKLRGLFGCVLASLAITAATLNGLSGDKDGADGLQSAQPTAARQGQNQLREHNLQNLPNNQLLDFYLLQSKDLKLILTLRIAYCKNIWKAIRVRMNIRELIHMPNWLAATTPPTEKA